MREVVQNQNGKIVAIDGLSLAGKSTMVQMLLERSEKAAVVRENTWDPHRTATSRLNRLLREMEISQALKQTAEEFLNSQQVIRDAGEYASQFRDPP